MGANEYKMTQNWGGQNPQTATTGAYQRQAGQGRRERAARAQSYQPVPPQTVVLPLNLSDSQVFVDEWRRDNAPHQNTAARMITGGVLGAALVHVIRNRGRR